MIDQNTLQRIAEAMHALRPEWNPRSLLTLLEKHRHRAPRDLAIAAIWVATDPKTQTPALLNEQAPWTVAGRATGLDASPRGAHPPTIAESCPEHIGWWPWNCGPCQAGTGDPPPPLAPLTQAQREVNARGIANLRAALRATKSQP